MDIKKLIHNKDYEAIEEALNDNPGLANEGIPYDEVTTTNAHPLHRICDAVFSGICTDKEAVVMAKIFLKHGAHIDGNGLVEKQDSPLVAAASLHADQVAILYIEKGATINHAGCHGGTALHWAAWCARPAVVERLIRAGAEINKRCIDFNSTPLFWAIHNWKNGGANNLPDLLQCVQLLLDAGAGTSIDTDGKTVSVFDTLDAGDAELKELLEKYK